MTIEEAKKMLPFIQAYAKGKTIQFRAHINDEWEDIKELGLNRFTGEYRIKPKPKYRPFETQRECWEEMHKHPDFGFIREKSTKVIYSIAMINNFYLSTQDTSEHLSDTLGIYEFLDGKPFGIKEE